MNTVDPDCRLYPDQISMLPHGSINYGYGSAPQVTAGYLQDNSYFDSLWQQQVVYLAWLSDYDCKELLGVFNRKADAFRAAIRERDRRLAEDEQLFRGARLRGEILTHKKWFITQRVVE